jgi:hypothetical protein
MDVNDVISNDFKQHYTSFIDGFESVYQVNDDGTLVGNPTRYKLITEWFNANRLTIVMITGIDVPPLEFLPTEKNKKNTNENKRRLLSYYSLSFAAYMKYCQVIQRVVNTQYHPVELMNVKAIDLV